MASHSVMHPGLWQPALRLILAASVIMGSPGPSTMSATAVGAAYGFRRSLPFVCGLIAGTLAVLLAVAIGVVTVILSIPYSGPVLNVGAAAYILYLAFRIATAPPLSSQHDAEPSSAFAGGLLLALANPKAYLAIAAVFAGTEFSGETPAFGAALKTTLLSAMIIIIHLVWLSAGVSLARVLRDPVQAHAVNIVLATILVVTTAITLLD
jgi:threonine/homoserine/homoserine lactone efflux protein